MNQSMKKKMAALALGVCIAAALAACAAGPDSTNAPADVQIPNPIVEYATLAEAEAAAGFTFTLPAQLPAGYADGMISVIHNELMQVVYSNGDAELTLRKAKGSEDISGDCNEYAETKECSISAADGTSYTVTLKGANGKVNVVTWADQEYTYSITVNPGQEGMGEADLLALATVMM